MTSGLCALLAFLLPVLPLHAETPAAQGGQLEAALRQRFAGEDEAWMLNAILSDDRQRQAFVQEGASAAQGDEAARRDFELRWRKKIVAFAQQYHRHLTTTDILPNAPSVEKMITEYEFNVTNYWMMSQPKAVQESAMKDIADGNAVLGIFRGTVEKRVRASRKKGAEVVQKYLSSAPAQEALAYQPPPPKPPAPTPKPAAKPQEKPAAKPTSKPTHGPAPGADSSALAPSPAAQDALEELRRAEAESGEAAASREAEAAARGVGRSFEGAAVEGGSVSSPVDATIGLARPLPNAGLLAAPEPGASQGGGFEVKAPPAPLVSRESVHKSNPGEVIVKRIVPTAVGAVFGALAGFFLGGPLGALAGLLVGAVAGYLLTKK